MPVSPPPRDYTRPEEARLRAAAGAGLTPVCPRCDVEMLRQGVPPRPEVAYVRRRTWWLCGACRRSVVIDDPRLPGAP